MKNYIPFSNGTEYMSWQEHNCLQCEKYECESSTEEEAGCKLAFQLDLSTMADNVIEELTVDSIGFTRKNTEGDNTFCDLCKRCNQFQTIINN